MKFSVIKLVVNKNGYHKGSGTYHGKVPKGTYVYACRCTDPDTLLYIKSTSRANAIIKLRMDYPQAVVYTRGRHANS